MDTKKLAMLALVIALGGAVNKYVIRRFWAGTILPR